MVVIFTKIGFVWLLLYLSKKNSVLQIRFCIMMLLAKITETYALVSWEMKNLGQDVVASRGGGGDGGAGYYGYYQNILMLIDNRKQTNPLGAETFASTKFQ